MSIKIEIQKEAAKLFPTGLCRDAEQEAFIQGGSFATDIIMKRIEDWLKVEATQHIGFDSISEEFSLSSDFLDLLKKAIKGE